MSKMFNGHHWGSLRASLGLFAGLRQLAKAKATELARAALAAAKDNAVACEL